LRPALAEVVARLAALDYEGLKRDGIDPSPDSADLSMWIRNYGETGATIVPLPDEAWAKAEAWPIEAHPGQTRVVVDLWTREDRTAELALGVVPAPRRIRVSGCPVARCWGRCHSGRHGTQMTLT
jgi:hypothetical protein